MPVFLSETVPSLPVPAVHMSLFASFGIGSREKMQSMPEAAK
jgi:hypothetical protein